MRDSPVPINVSATRMFDLRVTRIAAHARKQIEGDFRKTQFRPPLGKHVMMSQRRFEPAAQCAAFDHGNTYCAGAEAVIDF